MEPRYLHNGESGVRYMLGKVKKEIGEPNLGYLLAYEKSMHISGSNPRTITRHLRELRRVLGVLGDKDAKKATQTDVQEIVIAVNSSNLAPISKRKILLTLRVFWKFLYGIPRDSNEYPPVVKDVKPKHAEAMKINPNALITWEEVGKMVEVADSQLERALLMFLFCTGCRVGELLNTKISDLQLSSNPDVGSFVNVSGKTGSRQVELLAEAVPYLKNYLETERKAGRGNEPLFLYKDNALDFFNVRFVLKKLSERAGINKRVHSHLFRHGLSTYLAQMGMQESMMAMHFGYSPAIASYYTHLANVHGFMSKLNGGNGVDGKQMQRKRFAPKVCGRCKTENEFTAKVCVKCLGELSPSLNEIDELLAQILSDPQIKQRLREALGEKLGSAR